MQFVPAVAAVSLLAMSWIIWFGNLDEKQIQLVIRPSGNPGAYCTTSLAALLEAPIYRSESCIFLHSSASSPKNYIPKQENCNHIYILQDM